MEKNLKGKELKQSYLDKLKLTKTLKGKTKTSQVIALDSTCPDQKNLGLTMFMNIVRNRENSTSGFYCGAKPEMIQFVLQFKQLELELV